MSSELREPPARLLKKVSRIVQKLSGILSQTDEAGGVPAPLVGCRRWNYTVLRATVGPASSKGSYRNTQMRRNAIGWR